MRVFLIDASGGFPASDFDRVKSLLRVGDQVVMFDTHCYDMGKMDSQSAIDNLPFRGGGGTLLTQALKFVAQSYPALPVTIFTDGYIGDLADAKQIVDLFGVKVEEIIPFTGTAEWSMLRLEEALMPV